MRAGQIRDFLRRKNLVAEADHYRQSCERMRRLQGNLIGSHAWALKAFLYNTLRTYFGAPNIGALFFPLVKYMRTSVSRDAPSPMLHWVVLCHFGPREHVAPAFYPDDFLFNVNSLGASPPALILEPEVGERVNPNQPLACVEWFLANKPGVFQLPRRPL
jgi:hypothetical protein